MIARALKFLIDYIIAPGGAWTLSLLAGFDWIARTPEANRSLLGGVVLLLIVSVYAYQSGYKGLYRAGRKRYFFVVFIAPIVVGTLGLLAGLVFGHR